MKGSCICLLNWKKAYILPYVLQLAIETPSLGVDFMADIMAQHGLSTVFPDMESISITPQRVLKHPTDAISQRIAQNPSNVGEASSWIGPELSIVQGLQHKPSTYRKSELSYEKVNV